MIAVRIRRPVSMSERQRLQRTSAHPDNAENPQFGRHQQDLAMNDVDLIPVVRYGAAPASEGVLPNSSALVHSGAQILQSRIHQQGCDPGGRSEAPADLDRGEHVRT